MFNYKSICKVEMYTERLVERERKERIKRKKKTLYTSELPDHKRFQFAMMSFSCIWKLSIAKIKMKRVNVLNWIYSSLKISIIFMINSTLLDF